jgi:hypothetical protein
MKRFITALLTAACIALSCQRASAPACLPLLCFFKCGAGVGMLGYVIFIYNCEAQWYMYKITSCDEPPVYVATQKNMSAVAKTLDPARNEQVEFCEGPSRDAADIQGRADINNKTPIDPVFKCGPPGTPPPPSRTNVFAAFQQSVDGGSYVTVATVLADELFPVIVLPSSGTNGFTRSQMAQLRGATVITPPASAKDVKFRTVL